MKLCPYCAEEIQEAALICRHCNRDVRTGSTGEPPGEQLTGAASRTNTMAIVSLVCSVSSFVLLPVIGSILGVVFGYRARREIADSGGAEGGGALATAGIIVGWIGLALLIIWVLAFCSSRNALSLL